MYPWAVSSVNKKLFTPKIRIFGIIWRHMNRRNFLAGSACALGALASKRLLAESPTPLPIRIDVNRTSGRIPAEFTGLGYEISSVAVPGLLSPANSHYVQMVRTLGQRGVIRIGGNTSDYSSFQPGGKLVSSPKATVVNTESLRELGRFLNATGWKLIWGLNLGSGTEQRAVKEAQAVAAAAGDKLLAFEIGNEPDLFVHEGHRPAGYGYDQYLSEYRRYKAAIRAQLPSAPFAGPDVARETDWVARFAQDEGHDLKLLTHHYYRGGARSPRSSLNELLAPDPHLSRMLDAMRAASGKAAIPYRICETNSFSGGGKPGVSDTFGSALWTLDYMHTLAAHGASGLNLETGVNQLDFVSPYSPIMDDRHQHYSAAPDYYGMLAFAPTTGGELISADYDAAGLNLTAYAVRQSDGKLLVTIINKDQKRAAEAHINTGKRVSRAAAIRLSGPSLESRAGTTLGGSSLDSTGTWRATKRESVHLTNGEPSILVPAGSAALVTLDR